MKLRVNVLISFLSLLLFLQMSQFAKADVPGVQTLRESAHLICGNAAPLDCMPYDYLISNFVNQPKDAIISQESCVAPDGQETMSEYWLLVSLSETIMYFIDGYGVNGGMEIYSGSCDNLEMVGCQNVDNGNTFLGFYPPVSAQYYIRLLGYELADQDHFEVYLDCGMPQPLCAISIDNVEVGTCVSDSGTVSVSMSGVVNPEPSIPVFYAEIVTDMGYYAFSGEAVNGLWQASFELSGSVINYCAVYCGDSETGCGYSRAGTSLPTVLCDSSIVLRFNGSIDWNLNCGRRNGVVKLYEPGTDIHLYSYSVVVQDDGLFEIENPPSGNFDMILRIDGFLPKGFSNVELPSIESPFECGSLSSGDLNNDGVINIVDITMIINEFNTVLPEGSPISPLDTNCDGLINIADISMVIAAFGAIGDGVPLH